MPLYSIQPKFTYYNDNDTMTVAARNPMPVVGQHTPLDGSIQLMHIEYPDLRTDTAVPPMRKYRQGYQVKLTSLDVHGQMMIDEAILNCPNAGYDSYANWPWNLKAFANFRLMLVEFDESAGQTKTQIEQSIFNWFNRVYVNIDESYNQTVEIKSVHEKMLRLTTEYNGKFKILLDRPFKMSSNSPKMNFNFKIPLNRVITFDENRASSDPLNPHLYLFILGPQSSIDVDQKTMKRIGDLAGTNVPLMNVASFTKLNFMDI